jgi:hypothetical protein
MIPQDCGEKNGAAYTGGRSRHAHNSGDPGNLVRRENDDGLIIRTESCNDYKSCPIAREIRSIP